MSKILGYVYSSTKQYLENIPKSLRKEIGQFFTTPETALFMADLFEIAQNKKEITVLDTGAGSGILTAAFLERIEACTWIKKVSVTCYENDERILSLLNKNLQWIEQNTTVEFDFKVVSKNYILSQADDFNSSMLARLTPSKFDYVIGNPPYQKISKDAPEAKAMPSVCYGTPNLYFLFATMAIFNLEKDGELVYIIPRSWTSGAYFKKFREFLFSYCRLEHVHMFVSRTNVFKDEDVLQETIIIKVKKSIEPIRNITISTSNSFIDFSERTEIKVPYNLAVFGKDKYVFLVSNEKELATLKRLNSLSETLPSLGLKMKTGLTVDFRHKEQLQSFPSQNYVPLFYSQHIVGGVVKFPIGKNFEYIDTKQKGLLQNNTNYLFIKRFTAKEETRRLQCGVYLSKRFPEFDLISTQNKINFIAGKNELSECVVYGLYVIFNSTVYDQYYRILNGSTQVNSTEINSMPLPSLKVIEKMGQELIRLRDSSEKTCDSIIRNYI